MSVTNLQESETTINYVPRDLFDEREAKNQAVMEKNQADVRSEIVLLNAKVDRVEANLENKIDNVEIRLNAKMDVLNARMDVIDMKIDNLEENISTMMAGLINRFEDMKEHQNKWFTIFGFLFTAAAIVAPVAVAIVQHYLK